MGEPAVSFGRGPNFAYALPAGWTVGEEGNHALVLRSPDAAAGIIVFGLSGLMFPLSPDQFTHYSITQVMRMSQDARIANLQPVQPMPGYTTAAAMDVKYVLNGAQGPVWIDGIAVTNVAQGYGVCSGVMTIAGASVDKWPSYASWLPRVALQAVNIGPNPYGSTAMASTMHGITQREGQMQAQYRDWSKSTWDSVVAHRGAAQDRQQDALGPMLSGEQWDKDPFGGYATRRSTTPAVVWVHRDGREVSSLDPSYDPRTPMDADWRRVER